MASSPEESRGISARTEISRLLGYLAQPTAVLRSVRRGDLPRDLVAGLTVAAVALPQAVAYAAIAELPPQVGLYAAAVAAIAGGLWGSSRFLSTGPTNVSSVLVLGVLATVASPGEPTYLLAASLLALLAGVFLAALALVRFGALATLASRPVLIGFTAGAAILIAVGQLRNLLGLDVPSTPVLGDALAALVAHRGETSPMALAFGAGTVLVVLGVGRLWPRAPAALVGIVAAAFAVWLVGPETAGVRTVGSIPRSLPPFTFAAYGLPDVAMVRQILIGAAAVAAFGRVETLATAQALARRAGDRLDMNLELFGQGMANIATGLLSGYPSAGSLTRSALAQQSGARTQVTSVVVAVAVLGAALLLAPAAALIPKPALAGVLLVVAYGLVDRAAIAKTFRASPSEAAIMVATFAATLLLPLEFAVLAGIVVSLAMFIARSALPRVFPTVPDPTFRHFVEGEGSPDCPQLGIVTIRGPLFFGAVHHVEEELRHHHERHPGQVHLLLRMHGVEVCDLTGVEMLEATVREYRRLGGDVFLVRLRKPVRETLERSGFLELLGEDHVLQAEEAISHLFYHVLDPAICAYGCEERVFAECQAVVKHPYDERLTLPPRHPHDEARSLGPKAVAELLEGGGLAFDVREPVEHCRGHLPGATSLPLRELLERACEIPRDRSVVLVDRSGRRSGRAQDVLLDMGYDQVRTLRGGILAWIAEGLPVTAARDECAEGEPPPADEDVSSGCRGCEP